MKPHKYPRTYHLPSSPGRSNDDKVLTSLAAFEGKEVCITEKMDGENFSLYRDGCHARSMDSRNHPSRTWLKNFHGSIKHLIPKNTRVCGENLYAKHSILYDDLTSYFYGFSVWSGNIMWGWDDTKRLFYELGVTPVPCMYRGPYLGESLIERMGEYTTEHNKEGFVMRTTGLIARDNFSKRVGKWVRKNHVATTQHWMHKEMRMNGLRHEM